MCAMTSIQDGMFLQCLFAEEQSGYGSTLGGYLQPWISALLLHSRSLKSLHVLADGVPWVPVLRELAIKELRINMRWVKPWLNVIMADLSLCSCLERLSIVDTALNDKVSVDLPDLLLHGVATLQSVDLYNWYPNKIFTVPTGCLLRMVLKLEQHAMWQRWHAPCQCCTCVATGCKNGLLIFKRCQVCGS